MRYPTMALALVSCGGIHDLGFHGGGTTKAGETQRFLADLVDLRDMSMGIFDGIGPTCFFLILEACCLEIVDVPERK